MIFDEFPELENERIILRKMRTEDAGSLQAMEEDAAVYRYEPTFLPELLSESCEQFIAHDCDRLFREHSAILMGVYVKDSSEQFAGMVELYDYVPKRQKISIGLRLMQSYWNQGIGTMIVRLLTDYIQNDLKLTHITAHIMIQNKGSASTFLKNGYVQRRAPHEEDWGMGHPVIANKYVIYPENENI